ncbi:BTB/POZ domain-containing protein 6-like [Contarinia nasturtii]|uniref:BTB/POZ domain-containing protein 6-like n=1 Tax=Contarinia nasturtii TaxID=265458 RepID=UPI0012D42E90|nr:BTB/POZ domain-containing protein 6-like [Contarinia nasturtii]
MDEKLFMCNNGVAGRSSAKLYLDTKTADVTFIFGIDTDHPEYVPAHKILLSAGSPVFDAMFYGSLIEVGDIPIVDSSVAAFEEFLQFFYKSEVQLTSQHIGEVINLCKKYELNEAVEACEIPFQKSLTNKEMCWGYEVAVLLELENLQQFCEQKIRENAQEVLTSDTFLECNRVSVDNILQLVESKCNPLTIVEACMEWAKAENVRKNLDLNPLTLRGQLGNLFDRIPFTEIEMDEMFDFASKYRRIFSDDEIEVFTHTIVRKNFESSICASLPLSVLPKLNCDRRTGDFDLIEAQTSKCCFESNKNILLTEFYLPQLISNSNDNDRRRVEFIYTLNGPYTIYRGKMLMFEKVTLTSRGDTHIVLPEPIFLEANKTYSLGLIGQNYEFLKDFTFLQRRQLHRSVELENDIEIYFHPGAELISRMYFQSTAA